MTKIVQSPSGSPAQPAAVQNNSSTSVQIEVMAAQRAAIARLVSESQVARGTRSMTSIGGSVEMVPTPPGSNPALITEALATGDYAHAQYLVALDSWNPILKSVLSYSSPADKNPPPPPPPEIGPIVWNPIVFGGGVPVGGWASLSLFPNGGVNFIGSFHDSGFFSYNDSISFGVQAIATGDLFIYSHSGHMAGTIDSGSRDDPWNGQTQSPPLAGAWPIFGAGYRWKAQAAVGIDLGSLINDIKAAFAAVQTIGTIVSLFF